MDLGAFMQLVSAMDGNRDVGAMVPGDDAKDFRDGARYIPGEVTIARRNGERVTFDRNEHKWTMPDGTVLGGNKHW